MGLSTQQYCYFSASDLQGGDTSHPKSLECLPSSHAATYGEAFFLKA